MLFTLKTFVFRYRRTFSCLYTAQSRVENINGKENDGDTDISQKKSHAHKGTTQKAARLPMSFAPRTI
jgi:hypothetical protein